MVVGFYLDDTPLAASTLAGTGRTVIEPDLFDLTNIEVLNIAAQFRRHLPGGAGLQPE